MTITERPNFLFISTHDINPHLGCYADVWPGADAAFTPNLDRLASEGVRFDHAISAAPVCAPARSAIMMGRYPTAIGTMHMRSTAVPPADVELFPQTLRGHGYYTTNNWMTDMNVDVPPTAFDDCSVNAHWRDRPHADMPFFAAFHGFVTHESQLYAPDEQLERLLADVPSERRLRPEDVVLPPYYPNTEAFRKAWSNYLNLISAMDSWVGELLRQLDEDGLTDSTVVMFWSDHGAGLPGAKRWAAEAGVRVPMVFRWPDRIPAGSVRTDVVETMDMAATVLELAGIESPRQLDSVPLFSRSGAALDVHEYAFSARDRMVDERDTSRTVRDARFRYVRHFHPDRPWMQYSHFADKYPTWQELRRLRYEEARQEGEGGRPDLLTPLQRRLLSASKDPEELYDILDDPHQTTNLIADPSCAADLKRLRSALDEWLVATGDLGLKPEEDLLDSWNPGGSRPRAQTPALTCSESSVTASVDDSATSIGWTRQSPGVRDLHPVERILDQRMQFEHPWNLYTGPVDVGDGPVWFGAWRLGYAPSEIVSVPV